MVRSTKSRARRDPADRPSNLVGSVGESSAVRARPAREEIVVPAGTDRSRDESSAGGRRGSPRRVDPAGQSKKRARTPSSAGASSRDSLVAISKRPHQLVEIPSVTASVKTEVVGELVSVAPSPVKVEGAGFVMPSAPLSVNIEKCGGAAVGGTGAPYSEPQDAPKTKVEVPPSGRRDRR